MVGTNYVKIGFASNIQRRVKQLQTVFPFDLELIGQWPDATVLGEKRLHQVCAAYRIRGEWFDLPDDILQDKPLVRLALIAARPIRKPRQKAKKPQCLWTFLRAEYARQAWIDESA